MTKLREKIAWTIRDISFLPQNESVNYEIIDGELFATRSPHRLHQRICGKLFRYLDVWSENSGLGETIIAPGVIFSDFDSVIPDIDLSTKVGWANPSFKSPQCLKIHFAHQTISYQIDRLCKVNNRKRRSRTCKRRIDRRINA